MKLQWPGFGERGRSLWKLYGPKLLAAALGVVLMALPSGRESAGAAVQTEQQEFDLAGFEEKLARTLSRVSGAGEVEVVLSLDSGGRQILAQDVEQEGERVTRDTVTLNRGGGGQSVVPLQTDAPRFRGALVVCPGGGDPQVRLELLKAVSALTGLGADRVCVCQSGGLTGVEKTWNHGTRRK